MAQDTGAPEQESARIIAKQRQLGFILALTGILLQWSRGIDAWGIIFGWPVAVMGVLLCEKTILGDLRWSLFSFFPLVGAPLALIGIVIHNKIRGAAVLPGRRYLLWHEFVMLLAAMAAFWGGLSWLSYWCRQNGGCSFG